MRVLSGIVTVLLVCILCCACLTFLMRVCMFVCMCGRLDNCVGVLVIRVPVFTPFCTIFTVFVLYHLCIFILICFVCTNVRTTVAERKIHCC